MYELEMTLWLQAGFASFFPEYETITSTGIFGEGNSKNRFVIDVVLAVRCVFSERQRLRDIWRRQRCHETVRLRVCFHWKLTYRDFRAVDCIIAAKVTVIVYLFLVAAMFRCRVKFSEKRRCHWMALVLS